MITSFQWPAPGGVGLHPLRADADAARAGELLLDAAERARAARLATPLLRARFVSFRAGLRRLLAAYLGREPGGLRFAYGPHGRPELADAPELRFNLSPAADEALVAVTSGRAVGVDLELVDARIDLGAVAETVFADCERRALAACTPAGRAPFFFRTWVRKEAFIKALGLGFSRDPRRFAIAEDPQGQPRVVTSADGDEPAHFGISDVSLTTPGLAARAYAAVCIARAPGDPH